MSNILTSKNGKQYHLLDFNNLSERGLAPLKKAIEAAGAPIAKIIPAGQARRKDGIAMRTFAIKAMDEQEVTIQVNDTGDVSAVNLNKKIVPYTGAKNVAELGKIIADVLTGNAAAFAKSLARQLARADQTQPGVKRPGVKSSAQRLAEQNSRIETAKGTIAKAQEIRSQREQEAAQVRMKVESTKTQLKAEQALQRKLKAELEQLQGQMTDD